MLLNNFIGPTLLSSGFSQFLSTANDFLYGYILIALLVFAGFFFTFRTKFIQVKLFKDAIKVINEKSQSGGVSSFQALMISTASRVGTGNIAGVATAIAIGGPGAVFWMWLLGLLGGASAFIESTLAQIYKVKSPNPNDKVSRGGPAYYLQIALGKRWLGVLFSISLILCFGYGFNALQSYNVTSILSHYLGEDYINTNAPLIMGTILAVLTALIIFGGVHRIGFITSGIVPIMAIAYIGLGLFITIKNISAIPSIFSTIFREAFDFQAISGGFTGSCVMLGIKRGLFSNEAGMGSAPNAAAAADVSHPVKQGLVQMISVFLDTLIICSTTAMMLLVSNVGTEGLNGIPYVQAAIQSQVGSFGIHFISISIFLFAFSSIIGNYFYTETNLQFITNNKAALQLYRITVLVVVFFGAGLEFSTAWDLADVLMGIMALINLFAMFTLGKIAIRCLDDYNKQKHEGKNPVFKASSIGIDNTEYWK